MALRRMLGKRRRGGSMGPMKRRKMGGARRRLRRLRRRGGVRTKIMRAPVPDKMLTKMTYSDQITFTLSVAGALYAYQFRNSIYDPDKTGTGHQPLWHDQMATLFGNYRVHGIKYRFKLLNGNTNAFISGGVRMSNDAVTETAWSTLRERRSVKKWQIGSHFTGPWTVSGYMPVGKPWGMTKRDFLADEEFEAKFGENPVKESFLELYAQCNTGSGVLYVIADLVYYVELLNRKNVAGS